MAVNCPKCNTPNPETNKACSQCGTPLGAPAPGSRLIGGQGGILGGGQLKAGVKKPTGGISVGAASFADKVSFVSSGDAIKQLESMVIKGMDQQQLADVATRLNTLLNSMGVATDFARGGHP